MSSKLELVKEARQMPYDLKKEYLLKQEETTLHKLILSLMNRLGENFSAEITHGRDEYGRDLVVKQRDPLGNQYIGVIVKKGNSKGDLTGETTGEIDQIISQAKQALYHPCPLHELEAGVVKINQIWVFFIGRFTSSASLRIEHELKDASRRLFALEQIVDLFTENFPEVFFDSELAEFVESSIAKIESVSSTADRFKEFHTKYVNPWVSKWEHAGELTEFLSNVIYSQRMPFQKLTDVVASGKRIILTGDPGIGKTTAIRKIASDMMRSSFVAKSRNQGNEPFEVPILIKAREIAEKGADQIYNEFVTVPHLKCPISIKTLLVDGLDELHVDKRDSCIRKATEFADKFKCGLVITCRKIPMLMTALSPFDRYELLPFEYDQAITFVEQAIKDEQLIAILKDGIVHNELKIQLTPLALELLVEVATYEKEVPASLAEIFERYADLTCGKYDKGRGIETVFEYQVKRKFLAELAWEEFYLKGRLEIPNQSMDVFLQAYSKKYGWDEPTLRRFVSEIERTGLLRVEENVTFWHRSFLDFFIAMRISERRTEYPTLNKDIVNIYFDDIWADVTFYYVGIQREINDEIILGIAGWPASDFDACVLKILIGRLLQAAWHTPAESKIRAIEIGLQNIDQARSFVDQLLSASQRRLPTIYSDLFLMAICEYSFGSRTMLVQTSSVCNSLITVCDLTPLRNCLLLLWAQRSRLTEDKKRKKGAEVLALLARLEREGKLLVRDKFVSLFMLEQMETENRELLKSIRRKIKRTKEIYRGDMTKLLPPPKTRIRFSVNKRKGLNIDRLK